MLKLFVPILCDPEYIFQFNKIRLPQTSTGHLTSIEFVYLIFEYTPHTTNKTFPRYFPQHTTSVYFNYHNNHCLNIYFRVAMDIRVTTFAFTELAQR